MKKHITAFYFETLLLILVFVAVILALSTVFGAARARSADAERLTKAVGMAENAAEAVAASSDAEELCELLSRTGDAELDEAGVTVRDGEYRAQITWEPGSGIAYSVVTVFWNDREIYGLETAVCLSRYGGG